jgi:hypothetical protein
MIETYKPYIETAFSNAEKNITKLNLKVLYEK